MYEHNQHTDNNNSIKIDKKFLGALYEFIRSVEFELDMMFPGFASLQFLSYYKITDYIVSQKLSKNITIRMLCPLDEDNGKLIKQLVRFIGYKSIKTTLPKTSTNSLFFIRDKQDIFSFSIDIQKQQQYLGLIQCFEKPGIENLKINDDVEQPKITDHDVLIRNQNGRCKSV